MNVANNHPNNHLVDQDFASRFARILLEQKELPRGLFTQLPFSVEVSNNNLTQRRLQPGAFQALSQEQDLITRESGILRNRFDFFDKLNIIDILMTSPSYILPLVLELGLNEQMGWYGAVSPVPNMAQYATERMRIFALEARLKRFPVHIFQTDLEKNSCTEEIKLAQEKDNSGVKQVNLFFVRSVLGRYPHPEILLKNIYDSMGSGDYLLLCQGFYRSGSEDGLVRDYQALIPKLSNARSLADLINPDRPLEARWDSQITGGVQVYIEAEKEVEVFGVRVERGEKITVLRNTCFEETWLKQLFEDAGLDIIEIAYNKDYGLFLMQKE